MELDVTRRFSAQVSSGRVEAAMQPYQWFLLGVMVAWTPGLVALALTLRQPDVDQDGGSPHGA